MNTNKIRSIYSMAFLLLIFGMFTSSCNLLYPKVPLNTKEGVKFIQDNLNEAILKSKTDKKPLFVMVHANYCSTCRNMLKTIFPEKSVGDYYNSKFINAILDIDANSTDQFNKDYNIQGTPTFLLFSYDGKLIKKTSGFLDKDAIISFATDVN